MSVQQDRLTFFGVLIAVVVVVIGYLQLGGMYPTAGRADASPGDDAVQSSEEDAGGSDQEASNHDASATYRGGSESTQGVSESNESNESK